MESAPSPKKNSQITKKKKKISQSFIQYKSTEYAYDL